ncbi:MAG: BlaI/MecI/CopY family transcriptional regulator [Rhodanobacter sp.]|jgi:predicted transcriptional regulator|uniref:BlaI/MecI/CopY family transcriptional regulator n=2 Tax=unclassified Rhodanobacter TaxID=2621553 RepID=A0AB74UMA0_9GAMM|nr:BlaI/MecI/CopY family transcriptional regulator [Burkholderiaceae bacterium]
MKKIAEDMRKPTKAEMEILNVLWARDACTVREVHDVLRLGDRTGYTTVLKLLQLMHAKGLVERDDSQRAHIYRAAASKKRTQKYLLMDLVQRVFDGSSSQLVLQALGSQPTSREELDAIRKLLNQLDRESP